MKIPRRLLIGLAIFILVSPFLFIGGVYLFIFKVIYDHDHGYSRPGAVNKWFLAMQDGNGKEAVYWARRVFAYTSGLSYEMSYDDCYEYLAKAHELNGDFNKSLSYYDLFYEERKKSSFFRKREYSKEVEGNYARVYYKQGKLEEAFEEYCKFAEVCLEEYEDKLADPRYEYRLLEKLRNRITLEDDLFTMWLTPFLEYNEFLVFIENEYKVRGSPPEREDVMNFFRKLKEGKSSYSDDRLEAIRKQIIKARKPDEKKAREINHDNSS